MSSLAQLPPSEVRRLLVLATMSLRALPVARVPVAIIRANGAEICVDNTDAFYQGVAHLLLAQKRRLREAPDDSGLSGPLVVDLNDLAQHRVTCAICSEREPKRVRPDSCAWSSTTSLFDEFP